MDLPPVYLQHRHQRQRQHQQADHGSEAPLPLASVGQGRGGLAKRLRSVNDTTGSPDSDGRHHGPAQQLHPLEGPLPPVVEVPRGREEDDAVARDDGDGPRVRGPDVARVVALDLPGACGGQCGGLEVLLHDLQHEDAVHAAQHQVDEHEDLAQPAENGVGAEGGDEDEEGQVVHAHREEGQHPDDEEVVRHQGVDLREPHGLDADAVEDLLVREAIEELAPDDAEGGLMRVEEGLLQDQGEGEGDGEDGGDDESEDDLGIISSLSFKGLTCSLVVRYGAEGRGVIFRRVHV